MHLGDYYVNNSYKISSINIIYINDLLLSSGTIKTHTTKNVYQKHLYYIVRLMMVIHSYLNTYYIPFN